MQYAVDNIHHRNIQCIVSQYGMPQHTVGSTHKTSHGMVSFSTKARSGSSPCSDSIRPGRKTLRSAVCSCATSVFVFLQVLRSDAWTPETVRSN